MNIRLSYRTVEAIKNDPPGVGWKGLADNNQLVPAIKALRESGIGLKEAKDAVELYRAGGSLLNVEIYDAPPTLADTELYNVPGGVVHVIKCINGAYRVEYHQCIGHGATYHEAMQEVLHWMANR